MTIVILSQATSLGLLVQSTAARELVFYDTECIPYLYSSLPVSQFLASLIGLILSIIGLRPLVHIATLGGIALATILYGCKMHREVAMTDHF